MVKKQSIRFRLIAYPLLGIFFAVIAYFLVCSAMGFTFKYENGRLNRQRTGSIILSSRPGDANIYLNGNHYASKTPIFSFLTVQIGKLKQGSYVIKIEKAGYEAWEGTFRVYSGLVTWGTHILMLPNDKKFDAYNLSSGVKYLIVSSDKTRELIEAYDAENQTIAVWQAQTSNKTNTKLFEKRLATGETYQPLFYSPDNQRVLFEHKVGETKSYVVFETATDGNSWDITDTFRTSFDNYIFNPRNHDELYALRNKDLFRIKYAAKNLSGVVLSDVLGTYHENQNILIAQKVDGK